MDLLKIEGLSVKYSEKTILSKISFSIFAWQFLFN